MVNHSFFGNIRSRKRLFTMESEADKAYSDFLLKVKRTIFVDNVSPQVTTPLVKNAFGQFGTVVNVSVIPNYVESKNVGQCLLVEMENEKQVKNVVLETTNFLFMMGGMPRPVRCRMAEPEMFADRPRKPGRRITCCWLEPTDPDFQVAQELKQLAWKHQDEVYSLRKHQLEEEMKLAKQQEETLKSNYKKFEMLDALQLAVSIKQLGDRYGVNLEED